MFAYEAVTSKCGCENTVESMYSMFIGRKQFVSDI